MNQSRILPFYMAYPLPLYYQQEDSVTRDLEYLQQIYPAQARKYQKIIAEVLDRIDYEGSMIYDEYPDKWQIYRLTQIVVDKIKRMEEEERMASAAGTEDSNEAGTVNEEAEESAMLFSGRAPITDWEWISEFVQVLLSYEIYKKRHVNRNGILKF